MPVAHHPGETRRTFEGQGKPPTPVSVSSQQLSLQPPVQHPPFNSTQAHPHTYLDSSPTDASSVSSIRTGQSTYSVTSTQYSSSQHSHQQQHNYQGDLQYISHLDAIPEEASTSRTSRTASIGTAGTGHRGSAGLETQSFGESKQGDPGQQSYRGHGGIASASVRSDHSDTSAADGTPIHALFHKAYGADAVAEEQRLLDDTLHRQLTSLTATNSALTARTTQLEQRLRHSELRCKLLLDQIKSMPVSLSVAQVRLVCTLCVYVCIPLCIVYTLD